MKFHILQHAAFEGPGEIALWAEKRGHTVSVCHLYRGDALPVLDEFDVLVVLGGEMNIYQYRDWPWLDPETKFIAATLAAGKRVIGICLGAQFLADALGSRAVQNGAYEIGWLPVEWSREARSTFSTLPAKSTVLHWHGDTFGLPQGATRLASSAGCVEQGFFVPGKCLALQFHLEVDPTLTKQFVESQGDWPSGPYVGKPEQIVREAAAHCDANRQLLQALLDNFFEQS